MPYDTIFSPLAMRNLTIKNRILRSNIAGRFDNYDGSGAQARINWELKFARGGVGAIISSFVPVHPRGRILPNYATIVSDDRIPFWRELGTSGARSTIASTSFNSVTAGGSATSRRSTIRRDSARPAKMDPLHGFECERMTLAQIKEAVQAFAEGARRAREAGLDGVELHGANGYLITQFLSSAINDRDDEYGGVLANRARFVREIVQAIRARVGRDFHLQMKISATEFNNALIRREKPGNTVDDSIQVCQWLKEDGVDAIHVSSGQLVPASAQSRRRFSARGAAQELRQPDFERRARAPELSAVPGPADRRAVQEDVGGGARPGGRDRGAQSARCPRDQEGRWRYCR